MAPAAKSPVSSPRPRRGLLVALSLGVLLLQACPLPLYPALEGRLATLRLRLAAPPPRPGPEARPVLVVIDEESLRRVDARWPWNRRRIAGLVDALTDAGAAAVGLDLHFAAPSSEDPEQDVVLERALRRSGRTVLATGLTPTPEGMRLTLPRPRFVEAARGLGSPGILVDGAGHAFRIILVGVGVERTLYGLVVEMLRVAGGRSGSSPPRRAPEVLDLGQVAGLGPGPYRLSLGMAGSVPLDPRLLDAADRIAAADLLAGAVDPARLEGRLVLVGVTARSFRDRYDTALDRGVGGVELHATALAALLARHRLSGPAPLLLFLGALLAWALLLLAGMRLSAGRTATLAAAGVLAWWAAAVVAFGHGGWILPMVPPAGMAAMMALARWLARDPGEEAATAERTPAGEEEREQLPTLVPGYRGRERERDGPTRRRGARTGMAALPAGVEGSADEVAMLIAARLLDPRYQDVRLVGHGGMGLVYEVRDRERGGERLAVKVLSPMHATDEGIRQRFLREAERIADIEHPHLVRIFDVHDANLPYYSMEFLTAHSLADLLRSGAPLDPARAARLCHQACAGLRRVHERNVIHRDLKPENLLVEEGDRVKLIDFGVARFLDDPSLTQDGELLGTLRYMPPEQVRLGEVSARSDVYSLGLVLYEMLAGTRHARWASGRGPKLPLEVPAELGVPAGLVAVAEQAVNADPARRFATMAEMATALEPFMEEESGVREGEGSSGPSRKAPREG